ncbi:MAG: 4Fe-4S binding protein [Anaerolineae bacterium]
MRHGFIVVVCRACPDPPCARVCPTGALCPRDGGGVHLDADLCLGCGNCREACPFGAILWDPHQDKPQICVHCGYCASYCPYEVLRHEQIEEAAHAKG